MPRILLFCSIVLAIFSQILFAKDTTWTLSPSQFGPIKIGMTLTQISNTLHKPFSQTQPKLNLGEDPSCFITTLKNNTLPGISFMVDTQKVVRVNLSSKKFATDKGIRLGDSEEKVKQAYGHQIKVETHHYDPKGHYLTYEDKKTGDAIRYETDGKIVTLIYAGHSTQVHYVEDCL